MQGRDRSVAEHLLASHYAYWAATPLREVKGLLLTRMILPTLSTNCLLAQILRLLRRDSYKDLGGIFELRY